MKRLSSFGFVPATSQSRAEKRAKTSHDSEEPSPSGIEQPPSADSPPQIQPPESPQVPQTQSGAAKPTPSVNRNDLGTYSRDKLKSLSDEEKLWLIRNPCKPDMSYKYPGQKEYGKNRTFQHAWLREFPWLCYSKSCNGGFCVNCALFAKHLLTLGQLVTTPMTNFTRGKTTLQEHNEQFTHKEACKAVVDFLARMEKGALSDQYMQSQASTLVRENRLKILSILKTIVFCGKQNISLMGHREQADAGPDTNPGNFRALLNFRVEADDSVLEDHFESMPHNAQYISPQIQNDLISCTGEWIRKQIIEEVKTAKFFSICADEAADCSNKVHFVDESNTIREEFVDFILCDTGTTGVAIAEKILTAVGECGLNPEYLRGQAYDGAGNMAGKYRGAAVTIQSTCPKAVYVHCAAHSLNLCVVAACGVQSVQNMMSTMVEICLFFSNSPKRQLEFEKHIQSIEGARAKKLVSMCKTRWVARLDAVQLFFDLYPAVVKTFEVISESSSDGWNAESCRAAESLLTCITKFQFLVSFIMTKECLHYTRGITSSLQKRAKDICEAYAEVNTVVAALKDVRENISTKHKAWHDAAVNLGQKVNASEPQLPRRCAVQRGRSNTPADTPEEYYRRTVSIPFLDNLLSHLESCFSNIQQKSIEGMKIVPSVFMDKTMPACTSQDLSDTYGEDLPSPGFLESELDLWKHKWQSTSSQQLPDTPADALLYASKNMYPNIHTILRLICTLPVTSCECERSVSVLRRLKTYLRSTMGQDRLSGQALMHIHYWMQIDFQEVITVFARRNPCRMTLLDPFQ